VQNDDTILQNRFLELASRAASRCFYTYTDFLNTAEQELLFNTKTEICPVLIGGFANAERKIACFGNTKICGYDETPPIICLKAEPIIQKFADQLAHRDFLGALMGLGVRREVLGDIIIHENCGYLFCLERVSEYIITEFKKVRHTDIKCSVVTAPPQDCVTLPEQSQIVIASERLDAVVAAVYKLSRSESQTLFLQKKVYVCNKLCENLTHNPDNGDIISVRTYGRFIYEGIEKETKKGKLRVKVRIF